MSPSSDLSLSSAPISGAPGSSAPISNAPASSSQGSSSQESSAAVQRSQAAALIAAVPLSLPARIEAILYLKGKPLSLAEIAEIAGVNREEAELGLLTLMADYAHRDTALEIRQEGRSYGLQLRESLGDLVQNLLPLDLSTAALRTLATIALKKRILQSELVDLRGSGAYDHIKELVAQNFIERKRQSEGRSYWLSLTDKFHRTFAINSTEQQSKQQPGQNSGQHKQSGQQSGQPGARRQRPKAAEAPQDPSLDPAAPGPAGG